MTTLETIARISDALLPLTMLFCGFMLGMEMADWLSQPKNKNKKPDSDKQEDERK